MSNGNKGPSEKFWGSLNLDKLKEAVLGAPSKIKEDEKYGKQLYIDAAQWEDGGISISVYDKESQQRFSIGNLRVSNFSDNADSGNKGASASKAGEDLPF